MRLGGVGWGWTRGNPFDSFPIVFGRTTGMGAGPRRTLSDEGVGNTPRSARI